MSVPRRVALFLGVGLLAASQSGNIIRLADAEPLAIVAWRLVIATVLLAPLAGRRWRTLAKLTPGEWGLLVVAAIALASHFVTWTAAVQRTTVANAMVFFNINPVFTATAAFFLFRERITWRLVVAIVVGVMGIAVIGLADLSLRPEVMDGNLLAVLCSLLFTVYFLVGKRLRQKLDTAVYVPTLYGLAAVFSMALLPLSDAPLVQYDKVTWLAFVLMALVPTMIGHTSLNAAVRYIDAGRISVLTLTEPVAAGGVAYLAWGEAFTWQTAAGYVLIGAAVLVLFADRWVSRAAPVAQDG
jgi:drug/metabolite transporter (DMT)-like permease